MSGESTFFDDLFGLAGSVAIVTGGSGTLGLSMARGLARAGARVALVARQAEALARGVAEIERVGGEALAVPADVLVRTDLEGARDAILERWGGIDILVNGAGGNVPSATVRLDGTVFDLSADALREVVDLNLMGTLLPSQVFGEAMVRSGRGCIVNISSMAAGRPMTRTLGYGAAKAGIENITRWYATELARKHGAALRVNAIAPGFYLANQNRAVLMNNDGSLTARGQTVVDHTPMGRFGEPDELISALLFLCGPGASFVTGTIVPVDGGFDAFSGV